MGVPFFDLTRQYEHLRDEIEPAVLEVLAGGQYIGGRYLEEFETHFAKYVGTKYAIGVASGTDALTISLRSAGIKPGDEVVVPSFTFFATAESVANIGAVPVFADVDTDTMCITAESVEKVLSPRTRAVMPVHLFGHPAPMDELTQLARQKNLVIIEDAAQSAGTKYKGRRTGSLGDAAGFSFFPTKNLGAFGDGGIITTDDENIANMAKKLRNHGSVERYKNEMLGYNSRLDAVQAKILDIKLRHLEGFNAARRENHRKYAQLLGDVEQIALPVERDYAYHTFHQYTIRVLDGSRDELVEFLRGNGIGCAVYYPVPVHRLGPFEGSAKDEDLPGTMTLARQVLSLPIFPELTDEEIEQVAENIRRFFRR